MILLLLVLTLACVALWYSVLVVFYDAPRRRPSHPGRQSSPGRRRSPQTRSWSTRDVGLDRLTING